MRRPFGRKGGNMDYEALGDSIFAAIRRAPGDPVAYRDMMSLIRSMKDEGADKRSHELCAQLRSAAARSLALCPDKLFEVYRHTLLFDAPVSLDCYMLYMEIDRAPAERFYQPRRRVLRRAVDAIQRLIDGELDELFLSQPPRTGKTTLLMFTDTFIIGRDSELSNLYSAYSDTITRAFYSGVLEVLNDPATYKWHEIFPEAKVVQTNSQEETINIDRRKRYPSLTCRSLYGTLNGACDCNGFLISDDLIGGIEEALNKDRMMSAWSKVDNNLLPRAKEQARILWCGTRWSMVDPAGLRMELLRNDARFEKRRFEIINLPALSESDKSNFEYDYGVGFTTAYYHQRRASFERNNDMASWNAQYMGEPIEREGALFTPGEMRFYNGVLPDGEPDRLYMVCDPAFGGGDFVAAPVCFQYGDDIYVHDVVYDDSDKRVTLPLLADCARRNGVVTLRMEANKSTEGYKVELEKELERVGWRMSITTRPAPNDKSKGMRILDRAPDIREHMLFREDGVRSRPYSMFMQNVFSYKLLGKNKHDDAPDSLAMAADMALGAQRKAEIFRRFI